MQRKEYLYIFAPSIKSVGNGTPTTGLASDQSTHGGYGVKADYVHVSSSPSNF